MSDGQEKIEIDAITDKYNSVTIGEKKVLINYPMKAWRIVNADFGGIDGIQKSLTDDPIGFMCDRLVVLLQIGLVDPEQVTIEEIQSEIDEKNITELREEIIKNIMNALTGTLPDVKAGKKGNPQKAGK